MPRRPLTERSKIRAPELGRHARTLVGDLDDQRDAGRPGRHGDRAGAVDQAVLQQGREHLREAVGRGQRDQPAGAGGLTIRRPRRRTPAPTRRPAAARRRPAAPGRPAGCCRGRCPAGARRRSPAARPGPARCAASSRTVCWSSACRISSSRIDSAVSGVRSWCEASLANCRSAAISRSTRSALRSSSSADPVDLGDARRPQRLALLARPERLGRAAAGRPAAPAAPSPAAAPIPAAAASARHRAGQPHGRAPVLGSAESTRQRERPRAARRRAAPRRTATAGSTPGRESSREARPHGGSLTRARSGTPHLAPS